MYTSLTDFLAVCKIDWPLSPPAPQIVYIKPLIVKKGIATRALDEFLMDTDNRMYKVVNN